MTRPRFDSPLFDSEGRGKAFARTTDPETSHDAAATTTHHVPELEGRVLACLRQAGGEGATTKEMARSLRCDRDSLSPRMKPLRDKGLVRDSGMRRERATVWVLGSENDE